MLKSVHFCAVSKYTIYSIIIKKAVEIIMTAVSLIFDILLCFSFGSHISRVKLRKIFLKLYIH